MQLIHNATLLESYVEKYEIRQHFPTEVINHFHLYSARTGDAICEQGEHVTQLYLLVKGKATVSYVAENGKKLIVSFKQAFELFGDIIYQAESMHYIQLRLLSDVDLIGIPFIYYIHMCGCIFVFLQLAQRKNR